MAWYDTIGDIGKTALNAGSLWTAIPDATRGSYTDQAFNAITSDPGADQERQRKQLLYEQAQKAGQFGDIAEGNYNRGTIQGLTALNALQGQAMGQNSVSAEQLRQTLQQQVAQQRSLAAGASPQNAAMAARTAAIQTGRLSAGAAGQQALAGLQERNQAWQQYGGLAGQMRGQDINAALGSRGTATQGYGAGNAGTPEKSWLEKYGPALQGGLSAVTSTSKPPGMAPGTYTMSDRLLKTDIRDGAPDANKAIEGLRAYAYKYKDPQYGAGPQVGVMAQDLEKAGLRQAVVDTPAGKAIDPGKLSGANTAMIAALGRRVAELEGRGADPKAAAEQAQMERRRVTLNTETPPAIIHKERLDAIGRSDPAAAEAQRKLDLRRATLGLDRRVVDLEEVPPQSAMMAALARRAGGR